MNLKYLLIIISIILLINSVSASQTEPGIEDPCDSSPDDPMCSKECQEDPTADANNRLRKINKQAQEDAEKELIIAERNKDLIMEVLNSQIIYLTGILYYGD